MAYDVNQVESYIRDAAIARGIDPETAVRVAKSEGLARDTWQSNVTKNGRREPSYGAFQMLVGGSGTGFPAGMGNDFKRATGLDPENPENHLAMIDYALDQAASNGWGAWYGADKVGVSKWDGLENAQPIGVSGQAPSPVSSGLGDFIASIENAPQGQAAPQPTTIAQMMDVGGMNFAGTPTPNAKPETMMAAAPQAGPEMAFAPGNGLRGRAATAGTAAANPFEALLGGGEELPAMPALDEMFDYPLQDQPVRMGFAQENYDINRMNPEAARAARRAMDNIGVNPTINSSFRAPGYNEAVGGASASQHKHGNAMDISTRGMDNRQIAGLVDSLMAEGMGGIGVGRNIVHADIGAPRSWDYGNPIPAEVQSVIDARLEGGRLNQYPSDFGNIPAPRSRPTVAPDRPAGYVSASGLDSLALGELGADIGRDRRAGFGNGLALDNSMAAAMPAGPRATSFDIAAPAQAAASTRAPADYAIDYGPTLTTVGGLMEDLGAPSPASQSRAPSFSQSRFDNTFDVVSTTPGVTSGYTAPRSAPGVSVASPGPVAPAAPVGGAMDLTKTTDLGLPGLDGAARANMPTIDDGPVSMGGIGVPEMDPDTIYGRAGVFDKGRRTGLVVGGQLAGPIGAALGYTLGPSIGRRIGGKRYRGPAMGLSLPGFSGIGRMFGDNGYSTTPRGQAVAGYGRNFDANAAHKTYASLGGAQDAGSIARFEADMARERGQRNRTEGTSGGGRSIGDALSEAFGGLF